MLVEGARDALFLIQNGIPALALLGNYMTKGQKKMLGRFEQVYHMFDNDKGGDTARNYAKEYRRIHYKEEDPAAISRKTVKRVRYLLD